MYVDVYELWDYDAQADDQSTFGRNGGEIIIVERPWGTCAVFSGRQLDLLDRCCETAGLA